LAARGGGPGEGVIAGRDGGIRGGRWRIELERPARQVARVTAAEDAIRDLQPPDGTGDVIADDPGQGIGRPEGAGGQGGRIGCPVGEERPDLRPAGRCRVIEEPDPLAGRADEFDEEVACVPVVQVDANPDEGNVRRVRHGDDRDDGAAVVGHRDLRSEEDGRGGAVFQTLDAEADAATRGAVRAWSLEPAGGEHGSPLAGKAGRACPAKREPPGAALPSESSDRRAERLNCIC
jgi:hypothetical protein